MHMVKVSGSNSGKGVAILIPVYNEAGMVKQTVDAIPGYFRQIICVDDGSTDATKEQLLKTRAQVVSHAINLGQGAALQTAIEYALLDTRCEYFVTYDADGQHNIRDVERMLSMIRTKQLDIVLGSRFLGNGKNMKWSKKIILKLAIKFTNLMSGVKLTDAHNGLRVFNRTTAEQMQLTMADFSHASEIIDSIVDKNFSYAEAPVTITYTDYSRSKGQSILNSVNIVFDVVLNKVAKR